MVPPSSGVADDEAGVDQGTVDLHGEEGVARSALEDPTMDRGRQVVDREEQADESVRVVARQRIERDGGEVATTDAPAGPPIEELGPGRTHEQHRTDRLVADLVEQV